MVALESTTTYVELEIVKCLHPFRKARVDRCDAGLYNLWFPCCRELSACGCAGAGVRSHAFGDLLEIAWVLHSMRLFRDILSYKFTYVWFSETHRALTLFSLQFLTCFELKGWVEKGLLIQAQQ